jgi:uncharacterized protein YjiK
LNYFIHIFVIIVAASLHACSNNNFVDESATSFNTAVPEPSDLCLNFTGNGLFVVSDKGSVYEIGFNGKIIRKLTQYANPDPSKKDDLEGVCIDPVAKNIFVVNERTLRVSRLDENGKYIDSFVIPPSVLAPQSENSGIEGISLHGDIFYFVNQEKPRILLRYNRVTQQWLPHIPLDFCIDVNALSYDASDNTLWIVSSKSHKLFQCSTTGQPLKVQDISFIAKPEGVWVDRVANTAWICCDQSGKLYKIPLNKLTNYK